MKDLINFQYGNQAMRTVICNGEPWFVAKDVCDILELGDTSKAVARLDNDEKGTNSILTPGGKQDMLTVSEPGLYSLISGSRKAEAKPFQRWVNHEVLPTIRKTGQYVVPDALVQTVSPDLVVSEIISRLSPSQIIAILQTRVAPAKEQSTGMLDIVLRGPKKGNRRHSKIHRFNLGDRVRDMLRVGYTYQNISDILTADGYPVSLASVGRFAKRYLEEMERTEIRLPGGMQLAEEVRAIN